MGSRYLITFRSLNIIPNSPYPAMNCLLQNSSHSKLLSSHSKLIVPFVLLTLLLFPGLGQSEAQQQEHNQPQIRVRSQTHEQATTQPRAQSQAQSQTQRQSRNQTQIQVQSQDQAQIPDQTRSQGEAQTRAQPQVKPQTQAQHQARTQLQARTQSQVRTKSQSLKKERYSSLKEALYSSGLRSSNGPRNVNWIDGGDRYSYMQRNEETSSMEIRAYDPATKEDMLIFNAENHTFPGADSTFEYSSFQWSGDSKYLVFQSNFRPVYRRSGISDYYLYSVEEESLQLLVEDARTAELSPDGQKIGYERDGDLFVYTLETEEERRLTDSGGDYFYNGRFGWVYEEEFGLAQAWEWSPDSRYIAYWQVDEREVPIFQMTDYEGQHPDYETIPYPKVGDQNPSVRIGVVEVSSADKQWIDHPEDGYIPRLYWTSREGQLAVVHLNRLQNHLKLFFSDVRSGSSELIMEEQSDAWIDVFDFFAGINHLFFFPDDREEFFWISDRDGWSHIYRYDYDGHLKNQVTTGDWEVTYVHAVDGEDRRIYYTSTEVSPLERHLYAVDFDGSGKQQLTRVEGTHNIHMSPNTRYFLDRYSNTTTPTQVELWETDEGKLRTLEDNEAVREFTENHVYAPRELFAFTTSGGQQLDGYVIKPVDFDSTRSYPLLLNIYGGPGAQGVYNAWESTGWLQYLAQEGYVIVNVNNRGNGGYGKDFEKKVYKQLGKWEANDFVETARHMGAKSWVDSSRMAIRGHSYGGYMTTYTMFTHPGVFRVGIAGAPVTDWRLYDSIYTERYMGLLDENGEGYEQSSSVTHAGNLEGDLFVAHAAMDENVHLQNTMQLMTQLTSSGKDADLRIYPPGAHGVAYNSTSYLLLYETYTEYLNTHLK
ncbi:dipeptidyl-peptidase-4 [Fodinibius roseus]|uniref:Dipeptidyl-peptidase-4 n=2 Tax=Fodinibius roseus TaxID=1194090 RepID=A0A1M5DZH3_9BACT|nr:dipeptidyl-peptidase-4 [Fodinibius roseus]